MKDQKRNKNEKQENKQEKQENEEKPVFYSIYISTVNEVFRSESGHKGEFFSVRGRHLCARQMT